MSVDDQNDAGAVPDLLRAYKAEAGPPAGKKEQNWAAITAAVGAPVVGPRPHVLTPAKGSLGLAVVGIASLIAAVLGVRSVMPSDTAEVPEAPTRAATEAPVETSAPPPSPSVVSPPSTAEPTAVSLPSAPEPAARRAARAIEPTETLAEAAALTEPAHGLAEELAILREARAAVARGDASAALEALDRHAARFASGTLANEREHTRISALCLSHRRADAQRIAAALDPSPAVDRALARCGAP